MNKSEITKGRKKQKLQTRLEILDAARSLMQQKKKISLEDVAEKANISRATMYRYFSNLDLLFMEATLVLHHKTPDQIFEEVQELSFEERIFHIQKQYNEPAQKNEIVFRRFLSAFLSESIVSNGPTRGARRVKSLTKALEPFKEQFPEDTFQKLISAASVLTGIDALIICKDVCNLDNAESEETLKWALEMILKGIAAEGE